MSTSSHNMSDFNHGNQGVRLVHQLVRHGDMAEFNHGNAAIRCCFQNSLEFQQDAL